MDNDNLEESPIEIQHLLSECRTIFENCRYVAETQYIIAQEAEQQARLLLIVPSIIAAFCGILTAVGLPNWIGAFGAAASLVVGVAAALGIDKSAMQHNISGKQLTALKHEARFLFESYWKEISREQLVTEVRKLHDRYNALSQLSPPTNNKAYLEATKRIEAGQA